MHKHVVDQKKMMAAGVPFPAFMPKPFDVESSFVKIQYESTSTSIRRVAPAKQRKSWERVFKYPLSYPYLTVISSWPSDTRAKNLAVLLMEQATLEYENRLAKGRTGSRSKPRWHQIYGGLEMDKGKRTDLGMTASMLVFSGITEESTQAKIEKARDLLENYSDRPRILTLSGGDPLEFMLKKMQLSPTHVMWVGPQDRTIGL